MVGLYFPPGLPFGVEIDPSSRSTGQDSIFLEILPAIPIRIGANFASQTDTGNGWAASHVFAKWERGSPLWMDLTFHNKRILAQRSRPSRKKMAESWISKTLEASPADEEASRECRCR